VSVPRCDSGEKASPADAHQHGVEIRCLCLQLEAQRALAEDGLLLVEGVDRKRLALLRPRLAGGQRLGVRLAADDQVGSVAPDPVDLRRGGDARDEDLRRKPQAPRGEGHRHPVVSAGRRDHPGRRNPAQGEIGEGASDLERPRVLQELELEGDSHARNADLLASERDHRRAPDVAADRLLGGDDLRAGAEIHGPETDIVFPRRWILDMREGDFLRPAEPASYGP